MASYALHTVNRNNINKRLIENILYKKVKPGVKVSPNLVSAYYFRVYILHLKPKPIYGHFFGNLFTRVGEKSTLKG